MEEIYIALTSASVWAGVILTIIIQVAFKRSPVVLKNIGRSMNLKHLKRIRPIRHYPDAVTYESIKASAYFLLFCGSSAFLLILVSMGPLAPVLELPQWVFFIFLSPVLMVEVMWLRQKHLAESLIQHRRKLRVTMRCTTPL